MEIKSIKFPAKFVQNCDTVVKQAVFSLGLGPCGKVVKSLEWTLTRDFLTIIQHCDGEIKTFIYRVDDLCGRIEIEEA